MKNANLEQIVETGIFSTDLYKNLRREFVPFNEQLTAEYFAEEINSGRLSIEDAYRNFWSYEEDADLWDLPQDREWRALLPAWKKTITYVVSMLELKQAKGLVDSVVGGYLQAKKYLPKNVYNPFEDDYNFHYALLINNSSLKNFVAKKIDAQLESCNLFHSYENAAPLIRLLGRLKCYSPELRRIAFSNLDVELRCLAINTIGKTGYKGALLLPLLWLSEEETKIAALSAMAKLGRYHPKILESLDDSNPLVKLEAIKTLGELKHYDPRLLELYQNSSLVFKIAAANAIRKTIDYNAEGKFLVEIFFPELWNLYKAEDTELNTQKCDEQEHYLTYEDFLDVLLEDEINKDGIRYLKERYGLKLDSKDGNLGRVIAIHQRLKPQGYNPTVKKLSA